MTVKQVYKLEIDPRDTVLEWPDGVEILATRWVRENFVKVVLLADSDIKWHCMAETADGEPCQNTVSEPGERCHAHEE
jgi:hypothetical protein